jgi:hypothetical protein
MSLQHLNVALTGLVALVAAGMLVLARRLSRFVGEVPSGLPGLGLPNASWGDFPLVLSVSASCFIVILAQKAATSRASALRYRERSMRTWKLWAWLSQTRRALHSRRSAICRLRARHPRRDFSRVCTLRRSYGPKVARPGPLDCWSNAPGTI